jgi:hypothetical protein
VCCEVIVPKEDPNAMPTSVIDWREVLPVRFLEIVLAGRIDAQTTRDFCFRVNCGYGCQLTIRVTGEAGTCSADRLLTRKRPSRETVY